MKTKNIADIINIALETEFNNGVTVIVGKNQIYLDKTCEPPVYVVEEFEFYYHPETQEQPMYSVLDGFEKLEDAIEAAKSPNLYRINRLHNANTPGIDMSPKAFAHAVAQIPTVGRYDEQGHIILPADWNDDTTESGQSDGKLTIEAIRKRLDQSGQCYRMAADTICVYCDKAHNDYDTVRLTEHGDVALNGRVVSNEAFKRWLSAYTNS